VQVLGFQAYPPQRRRMLFPGAFLQTPARAAYLDHTRALMWAAGRFRDLEDHRIHGTGPPLPVFSISPSMSRGFQSRQ